MMQKLTGLEYLKCSITCNHDKAYEKATWDDRLSYFKSKLELNLNKEEIFKDASNPIGLKAGILAYNKTKNSESSGYMISLDACSSGLQILSLLISCRKSWDLCGGVSTDCVDSYTTIYSAMDINNTITRKKVKNTIMTALYGSQSMPQATFGNNVDMFYETMENMVPGAWDLNIALQELWGEVEDSKYSWTLPDNFFAHIQTQDKEFIPIKFLDKEYHVPVKIDKRPDFHKGLGPNIVHSIDGFIVREMFRRCSYNKKTITRVINSLDHIGTVGKSAHKVRQLWDHYQKSGFLSLRILDYLYEDTMGLVDSLIIGRLIKELPQEPFDLVSVHDCFRSHPNYGNDVRTQYNIIMADINDSDMLHEIANEISGKDLGVVKAGSIDRNKILEGNYLLA